MKTRIKSVIWNIRKQKTKKYIKTARRKKNPPNEDNIIRLYNFMRSNILLIGVPEEKRKSKKLEIYLKK